jgi:hypothetical protein
VFLKGSAAVHIEEPFLVSGRTLFGSRQNYFGFHVEPSVERRSSKGSPMGTAKKTFLILDSTFLLRVESTM